MNSEQALLNEIAQGSETAFRDFFDLYYPQVFQYLHKVVKSKEIADELTSDIFLKLWLGREMMPEIQSLPAFLRKVSSNKAIDFFRQVARQQEIQQLLAKELNTTTTVTADNRLMDQEYYSLLSRALDLLSPQRKLVFSLSRIEGLTHDQIAEKLQLSRNTVRNTIVESLKVVRDYLRKQGIDGAAFWLIFILC